MPEDIQPGVANNDTGEVSLAVDVYHTDDSIVICAPIAGVKRADLQITVTDDVLTIKGTRTRDDDVPPENYFTNECYWGSFSRSIVLPSHILARKCVAKFKDGVLKVVIPKSEQLKTQVVRINPA